MLPYKDDLASMEHLFFMLKAGGKCQRFCEHNGNSVVVMPGESSCATIHDKDIRIYCISALMAARNRGKPLNRTVRFTAYDFLVSPNRPTTGANYNLLREFLCRIAGIRIVTSIKTGSYRQESNLGLLDKIDIIYKDETDENNLIIAIEVTFPDWLYQLIETQRVKTILPDYFRLRKPLDRRIYELCGKQADWTVFLDLLHKKSGSTSTLYRFRQAIKELVASNDLPDYRLQYYEKKDITKEKPNFINSVEKEKILSWAL
ncbi:replication initiator protein A [Neisseria iguanae]|nr:replication initiator protein A [Neisseria iguanae]